MKLAVQITPEKSGLPHRHLGEVLRDIASTGYRHVQVSNLDGTSAETYRLELDNVGLNVAAYEVELHDLTARPDAIIAEAKALGAEWIVIRPVQIDEFGDGWKLTGERMTKLAEKLRAAGFRVAYRHGRHDFYKDGQGTGLESLLTGTGPIISAVVDLESANKTTEGSVEWLKRLQGRACLAAGLYKSKDSTDSVDDDHLDWQEIVATGERTGVEWALVSIENKVDHFVDNARASHAFFSSLGVED